MKRIGVFICHCGINISSTIDVKGVVEFVRHLPGVVTAEDYTYMCSEPGQELIREAFDRFFFAGAESEIHLFKATLETVYGIKKIPA